MRLLKRGSKKPSVVFRNGKYEESREELRNPGRGWYIVHSFEADEDVQEDEWKWCVCREHTLALVLIDISKYRSGTIPDDTLVNINRLIGMFGREGQEIILRFVYDREGRGIEREPTLLSIVLTHMSQLGPIIKENADNIYTLQGLFVGNWGEMHGSKFLTGKHLGRLAKTLWEATEDSCYLAVRRPVQWRMVMKEIHSKDYPFPIEEIHSIEEVLENAIAYRIGLYNDGIFGSESHLGTYGIQPRTEAGWVNPWNPVDEMKFEDQLCKYVPNGGEALFGDGTLDAREYLKTLRRLHISYLNSVYDEKILDHWKSKKCVDKGVYKGLTLFDYIGRHLGYRFVVRNVKFSSFPEYAFTIEIENVGLANLYEEAECYLIFEMEDGTTMDEGTSLSISVIMETDPTQWNSGEVISVNTAFTMEKWGEYQLYLGLKRKKDGKVIRFANLGERMKSEELWLGTLIMEGANR